MKQAKRSLISMMMLLALVVGQVALFAIPEPAHAQWAVTNPDLVGVETQKNIREIIKENLRDAFIAAIGTTLMNTLFYSVGNVAQRTAVWVASGGPGDQPLYSREQASDFARNTGAVVVMSVYDSLSEEDILRNIDIDIDIPDSAAYLLGIRQGLMSAYVEPEVDFDFRDYHESYPAYLASVAASDMTAAEKTQAILGMSATAFTHNEFGNGLKLYSETLLEAQQESDHAAEEFYANGGFLSQLDPTSGYRDLPASFVRDQLYDDIRRAQDLPYTTFSNMFSGDNILLQLGVYGGQVFTGTLVSELMNRYYGGLFEGVSPSFSTNPFDPDSATSFSRERAQQLFQGFTAFRPIQVSDYHMVSQLSSCATSRFGSTRPLFSCAMDTSFAAAVTRAETGATLTIEGAIDEGYINGSWPLIPPTDTSRNQDDGCYTYGFCHSNLVKLRKARIISIGWEMAAESDQNTAENPVTLQEVVDGFHECNEDGERDQDHPWCHLVDPNWVLKAPESSCRTLAYGQLLQANGSATREQECVDLQTCIAEDENGQCTGGYGYCVREENTWRFQGESCPEHYASCLSFETRDDELVDYLTTTTDFAECGEDEVGCQWYATTQYPSVEGEYNWPVVNDVDEALDGNDAQMRIAFFNAESELCDASQAGCSEVYERGTSLNLNVIPNSSFELDEDGNNWPDGWLSEDWSGLSYNNEDTYARSGNAAISSGSGELYRYGVQLSQSRFYTLSYYTRQDTTGADSVTVKLQLADETSAESVDLDGTSYSDDCSIEDLDGDGNYETISLTTTPDDDSYERAECIFTAPTLSNQASDIDAYVLVTASSVWIDDVQVVQAEDISTYHVGYNSTTSAQYVQLAPDYLGCTGGEDDSAACGDFATVCSANDVGCALYSPINGDPDVSGVVSELDVCSEGCVGYDTFKQEATRYEPNGEFPLYFIPDSAETCDETAVGCDEFTNLSTEESEYFTYLRACVTGDQADANTGGDQSAIFYTWEGSDETGYQLKTWSLLESDLDGIAYQNYTHATSGEVDVDAGAGPCTNWETDEDGITCADDSDGDLTFDTDTEDCDEHSDILENPDCREFYDVDGDIHYRLWSETVTVNDACVSYRKTDVAGLGSDTDGDGTDDGQENCTEAGGYFDTATNICRFYGYSGESITCDDSEAGCRAFTGGRSNNSRVALTDLFEGGVLTDWEAANATDVELSNESIATDGHSLKSSGETVWTHQYDEGSECADEDGCASSGSVLGGECTVTEGDQYCGTLHNELFANKTYTLSFWAKGAGEMDIGFDLEAGSSPGVEVAFEEGLELTSDWKQYSLGPLDMNENDYPDFGAGTVLVFDPTSSTTVWIDNVVLREGEDELTLIKDSWVTPATCDINLEGNASPQYQLGCQEYIDSDGDEVYLKSFSRLCDGDKVGCKAYYETQESASEYAAIVNGICSDLNGAEVTESTDCYLLSTTSGTAYDTNSPKLCVIATGDSSCHFDLEDNAIPVARLASEADLAHISYGPETVIVPADADLYAIVGFDDTCNAGGAGCTELGSPELSFDRNTVEEWTDTYIIDDPDTYSSTRCTNDESWCEAFDAGSEGVYYFKDPGNSVCEYKTGITIDGESYDGWFREGTSEFCYGTGTCVESGTSCTTDSECRVDSGTCSDTGLSCSQDYDCNTDAFCEGLSSDTCEVDDPSFLKSGTFSGAWKNGDSEYLGYVALCEGDYDTCSEFEDPLAIDDDEFYGNDGVEGESFHFLNNDRLEDTDILSAASCKGQVSPSEGCVLFEDAADSGLDYNASATYISSVHADELHGDEPFALVNPIDCSDEKNRAIVLSDGSEVDLCSQRCVYENGNLFSRSSGTFSTTPGAILKEVYSFGSSCYVDADCVDMESDTGDLIEGECTSVVETTNFLGSTVQNDVPVLENDTNRVMSVTRDRVCSEWLACASSFTVWDEELGKYREVCDSINLCTSYSESGDAFCSEWDPDDPAVVLDIERYTNRDVSWYGEEYSGYAIPDQFPVQHLSQVNIAPEKVCTIVSTGEVFDAACVTDTDCVDYGALSSCENAASDYRLVYNAGAPESCSDPDTASNRGESCTVGYCSEGGSACTTDSQCSAGSCITGQCYAVGTDSCSVDSDCSTGDMCLGGFCSSQDTTVDGCDLDFSCGANTCVASVGTKEGACYRGQCIVDADGQAFNTDDAEEFACRAQPEANSPFGNNIVSEWSYYDPSGDGELADPTSDVDTVPANAFAYDTLNGYENAELCAPGEDCTCSYSNIGSSLGHEAYIDFDTDLDEIRNSLALSLASDYGLSSNALLAAELGLCSGGSNNGNFCLIDGPDRSDEYGCFANNTADKDAAISTCNPIVKEDVLIGLEGYCLERDTGINLEGDPTTGACLTWYPVDQLLGASDLTAKYTEAGYFDEEAAYCGYSTLYVDVPASIAELDGVTNDQTGSVKWKPSNAPIACAEQKGLSGDSWSRCVDQNLSYFACPPGQFMIMGEFYTDDADDKKDDSFAHSCKIGGGDNDCPFVCVPERAVNEDGDYFRDYVEEVYQSDSDNQYEAGALSYVAVDRMWETDVYMFEKAYTFNDVALESQNYVAYGIEVDQTLVNFHSSSVGAQTGCGIWTGGMTAEDQDVSGSTNCLSHSGSATNGWHGYEQATAGDYYLACSDHYVVDDGSFSSAAFTHRLNYAGEEYTIDADDPELEYVYDTELAPFGATLSAKSLKRDNDVVPAKLPACYTSSSYIIDRTSYEITPPSKVGDCDTLTDFAISPSESEGRTFAMFESFMSIGGDNFSWTPIYTGDPTELISQIFAVSQGALRYEDGIFSLDDEDYFDDVDDFHDGSMTTESERLDAWDVRSSGTPPTVWSIDVNNCTGPYCREGTEGRLTVNSSDEGDQTGESGFFRVNLKFYAAADKNQLPLRRVIVDWQDGDEVSGSPSTENFYKNHRGLTPDSDSVSYCDTSDEWGMTDDSCDPNYFNYSHNYFCSDSVLADLDACTTGDDGYAENAPCISTVDGAEVCTYRPRVHLRDQWGWCTGVCDGSIDQDGTEGCYAGVDSKDGSDYGLDSTNEPLSECSYELYPNTVGDTDPWVYYDGNIYVGTD